MQDQVFKIIGHRGACGDAPENTLASFSRAISLGASWVEFDVRFSSDGVPVVIHDATLNRTTKMKGPVNKTPAWKLASDSGSSAGEVPTLAQVLGLLDEHGINCYVEMKANPPGGLEKVLATMGSPRPGRVLSSFDHECLMQARDMSADLHIQALFSRPPYRQPSWIRAIDPMEVAVNFDRLTASNAVRLKGWGYPLVAYTVNTREKLRLARAWGLSGVFSDFPGVFL